MKGKHLILLFTNSYKLFSWLEFQGLAGGGGVGGSGMLEPFSWAGPGACAVCKRSLSLGTAPFCIMHSLTETFLKTLRIQHKRLLLEKDRTVLASEMITVRDGNTYYYIKFHELLMVLKSKIKGIKDHFWEILDIPLVILKMERKRIKHGPAFRIKTVPQSNQGVGKGRFLCVEIFQLISE